MTRGRLLAEHEWVAVGVSGLEPAAEDIVRSNSNSLVVAGPGAGKTELLAQRASFLLETGRCPNPNRILAISFKRDAAKNLDTRVKARCGERAERFDSLTLDAFAKRLVDRFRPAIPADWRPRAGYQVRLTGIPLPDSRAWLLNADLPPGYAPPNVQLWKDHDVRRVMDELMHGVDLPYDAADLHVLKRSWGLHWWREQLAAAPGIPSLSFPMLNRLAGFLLRTNPKVLAALRLTYSHVFMDEFQDTTAAQWDLVCSALQGSPAIVTAVGDGKQRIMVWAGAKADIFDRFREDFAALPTALVRNYRSVPELVEVQHVIALALEADATKPVAACSRAGPGVCAIFEYGTPEDEAADIARMIASEIASGASPRDFCILVRQRPGDMIPHLASALMQSGVKLRDESALQDLRAEPVTTVVLAALVLATRKRAPAAWKQLLTEVASLSGLDPDGDAAEIERITTEHKDLVVAHLAAGLLFADLPPRVLSLLGPERYRATYRQYAAGDYLATVATELGKALQASFVSVGDPSRVADDFAGADVVPAMTIHKSKGLEFGTVIFLGLEDGQWWGFKTAPDEEKRAFFVAFSRAIRRVIFTWSDKRDGRYGRKQQKRDDVEALHEILHRAGVASVDRRAV